MQLLNLLTTFIALSPTGIPASPILITAEEPIRISQTACHCDDSGRFVITTHSNSFGIFTATWDYQRNPESQLSYSASSPEAVPARSSSIEFDTACPSHRAIWIKVQACQWIPANSETSSGEGSAENSVQNPPSTSQWFETHDCATETRNYFVRDGVCFAE